MANVFKLNSDQPIKTKKRYEVTLHYPSGDWLITYEQVEIDSDKWRVISSIQLVKANPPTSQETGILPDGRPFPGGSQIVNMPDMTAGVQDPANYPSQSQLSGFDKNNIPSQ